MHFPKRSLKLGQVVCIWCMYREHQKLLGTTGAFLLRLPSTHNAARLNEENSAEHTKNQASCGFSKVENLLFLISQRDQELLELKKVWLPQWYSVDREDSQLGFRVKRRTLQNGTRGDESRYCIPESQTSTFATLELRYFSPFSLPLVQTRVWESQLWGRNNSVCKNPRLLSRSNHGMCDSCWLIQKWLEHECQFSGHGSKSQFDSYSSKLDLIQPSNLALFWRFIGCHSAEISLWKLHQWSQQLRDAHSKERHCRIRAKRWYPNHQLELLVIDPTQSWAQDNGGVRHKMSLQNTHVAQTGCEQSKKPPPPFTPKDPTRQTCAREKQIGSSKFSPNPAPKVIKCPRPFIVSTDTRPKNCPFWAVVPCTPWAAVLSPSSSVSSFPLQICGLLWRQTHSPLASMIHQASSENARKYRSWKE